MRKFLAIENSMSNGVSFSWLKANNTFDAYEMVEDRFGGSVVILTITETKQLKKVIENGK